MNSARQAGPSSRDARPRFHAPLWAALAGLALFAAYSNFFTNRFQFDDALTIEHNVYIRNLKNSALFFKDASTFTAAPQNAAYRPLAALSFALDYRWGGGLDPRAFHLTQLLLHAALAALCFALFRRLLNAAGPLRDNDALALFGAALFALHPVNTEPLNYITLRSEILSTLGAVGGFLLYLAAPRLRRTGIWLLPMAAGALAKPPAIVLPLLLAAWLALFPEDLRRPGEARCPAPWRRWGLVTGSGLAVAAALYVFLARMGGPLLNYGATSRAVYFQTQLFAWVHYLRFFVLPLGLTADSDWTPIPQWYDTRVLAGALFTILLLAAGFVFALRRPRRGRLFLFGLLWYYIALIPASSFQPTPNVVELYRLYFPMIGLILCLLALAGEAMERVKFNPALLARRRAVLALAALALLTTHAFATYARNRDWRDELTLWQSTVEASPRNGRAWAILGELFLQRDDLRNARFCIARAARYAPDYSMNALNFAMLDLKEGRMAEAGEKLQKVVELWPDDASARSSYGEWLRLNHRPDEAAVQLKAAVALSPAYLNPRHSLLSLYADYGQWESFCGLAGETQTINPQPGLGEAIKRYCGKPGSGPLPGNPAVSAPVAPR